MENSHTQLEEYHGKYDEAVERFDRMVMTLISMSEITLDMSSEEILLAISENSSIGPIERDVENSMYTWVFTSGIQWSGSSVMNVSNYTKFYIDVMKLGDTLEVKLSLRYHLPNEELFFQDDILEEAEGNLPSEPIILKYTL